MTKLKLGCFIFLFQTVVYAKNVCDTEELLGLVDRPTFARGVCIVPTHKSLLEYGATHFKLIGEGESNSVGEGEYRLGLGRDTELDINPPNYYQQTIDPKAGFGFTTIGLKSIFYQNEHFAFSLDGGLVPSGGSIYFGSRGLHGFINGIWYDEVNDVFAHSFVFGIIRLNLRILAHLILITHLALNFPNHSSGLMNSMGKTNLIQIQG
jgi:hypothetical protein